MMKFAKASLTTLAECRAEFYTIAITNCSDFPIGFVVIVN